ncbi:hypothetical protein QTP70_020004 [Hemibagrus guttatus]|uniref:UPAR/Ly6 domain-containing protein n=1 Tax=Hemibagrus guttatus TaxID=175788 RepID=A0AAE0QEP9_9TELE|nr:hypothetical protein QTP70_020004 [Hemibagrus guttatus]
MCQQCIPLGFAPCTSTQINCSTQCATATVYFAITLHVRCFTGDSRGMNINVQTCSTPDLCVNGSLNTGIINVINTAECCSTNFCNNKTLPALSLMCHNCISEQCSEINCPDQCASVTLFIVSNGKNMTSVIKTCAIPQMCSSGSINLGELLMTSNVMCCNSTLCNKETLPALPKQAPNGRICYTCDAHGCSAKVDCEGSEDRCISASVQQGSSTVSLKGCVSKSFCVESRSSSVPGFGVAKVQCCEGNLCNGAGIFTLNFLLMIVPLLSSILFY